MADSYGAAVGSALRDFVLALRGVAAYGAPPQPGPQLGDEAVNSAREALGGRLEPIPPVRLRWYPPDIEKAQQKATNGDLTLIGQLNESMNLDGTIRGLKDARTSVVNFPRRYYGSPDVVEVLLAKNNSDRDVYDEMIPSSEARLMAGDELMCGVAIGEMVPVPGRNFPVLIRRYPQNLYYLWSKNQWFYRSVVGLIPIEPGIPNRETGNWWVLHIGGGRLSPWNSGLWNTCGRSYINKTQTLFARQAYEMKHSHPARVATAGLGAVENQRQDLLRSMIRWALNAAFVMPVGYDVKLVESNGQGIKVYQESIKTYNEEIATALCGSAVMLQGTAGFSNLDVFRVVQTDLIRTTARAWDHTVNTQILPAFIAGRWGTEALINATTVETDTRAPKDQAAEAQVLTSLGGAIKVLNEALAAAQQATPEEKVRIALDVPELMARFGVPTTRVRVDPAVVAQLQQAGADAEAAREQDGEAEAMATQAQARAVRAMRLARQRP